MAVNNRAGANFIPLIRDYYNQSRNPQGNLGKMMLRRMNADHAKLSDWAIGLLPKLSVSKAVDLGCGAGGNVARLADLYKGAHVTGVDYSPLAVEVSRTFNAKAVKKGDVDIREGNVSALDLSAGSFDLATAFETVYYWPGLEACFEEVARVLKPGGTFLIANKSDGTDRAGKYYRTIIDGMELYSADDLAAALKAAGFSDVECTHHKTKPWIAVLATK